MEERVEHPSYYCSGIECIELLDSLCDGYEGIVAFDIGQSKYLYRCGSKKEEGLSSIEKAIEDIDKNIFYIKDIKKRKGLRVFSGKDKPSWLAQFIAREFCVNKPKEIHSYIESYISAFMCKSDSGIYIDVELALDSLIHIAEYYRNLRDTSIEAEK